MTGRDGKQRVATVDCDLSLKNEKPGRKEIAHRLRQEQNMGNIVGSVDVFRTAGGVGAGGWAPTGRRVFATGSCRTVGVAS